MCQYTYEQFVQLVRSAIPHRFGSQWLDSEQEQAVCAPLTPPTFIVAGPGTGKTTVLILRLLKHIFVDGVRPEQIIATTFTRKAAVELRSRILSWGYAVLDYAREHAPDQSYQQQWLSELDMTQVYTGTLDSLAGEFLFRERQPGQIVPATAGEYLTTALMLRQGLFPQQRHQHPDLKQLLRKLDLLTTHFSDTDSMVDALRSLADRVRLDGVDLQKYAQKSAGHRVLCDAIQDYLDYLDRNHLADFARLEELLLQRLKAGNLGQMLGNIRVLLVDEFQDTNYLQEQIYYEICLRTRVSLTVVGDDDQSIYRFRGATIEIFSNFPTRICSVLGSNWQPVVVYLHRNYRSTRRIVEFCQRFVDCDPAYLNVRVVGKPQLVASAPHATMPEKNIPVLGMFRPDVETLARDLARFLCDIFRGNGRVINYNGGSYRIQRAQDGDFGDAVLLAHSVQEQRDGRARLPLLLRQELENRDIPVYNLRGRRLNEIPELRSLLGLALLCIDPELTILRGIQTMTPNVQNTINQWVEDAQNFMRTNPQPIGLSTFVQDWQSRRPSNSSRMTNWPNEWPLLELLFDLTTWFPSLHSKPEGQVYLEAVARTVKEASQFAKYSSHIVFQPSHEQSSVQEAIHTVFEPIAKGIIDVNEEIMPHVPRNYFQIMTIHQAKGLEFPLVIVDVGSDFQKDYHAQRWLRAPDEANSVHKVEDDIADFTEVGCLRTARTGRERAWDDLRRLYFVAFSRAQEVLLLVGLNSVIPELSNGLRHPNPVPAIGCGALSNGKNYMKFECAEKWNPTMGPEVVALI
jgi:DNA helicase-2/ATP-dependent DNA helicase PcrA